jgi:uncharacterized protein
MKALSRCLAVAGLLLVTWLAAPAALAAPPLVVDDANLLLPEQEADLLKRAEAIQAAYSFDVIVYTTLTPGTLTPEQASEAVLQDYQADAIVFYIAIGTRDWQVTTTPGRGNAVFTAYMYDQVMRPRIQDKLYLEDFWGAYSEFLDLSKAALKQAAKGQPYDYGNPYRGYNVFLVAGGVGAGVGLLAAGSTVAVWKRGLKTARPERAAANYQRPGSLQFSVREDTLVNSHTAVTRLPQQSNSGGRSLGGGGGGFGGGGGGFGGGGGSHIGGGGGRTMGGKF